MDRLKGKVAIVTGGTRGIGFGIIKSFLEEGAMVLGTYSKDSEAKDRALECLKKISNNINFIKSDIKVFENSKTIVDKCIELYGKVDILVNNAGISKVGLLMDATKEDIDEIFMVNLIGPIYLTKEVINKMSSGSIINISSIWGEVGASCESLYSATKGGINLFTSALGKELAMGKVRVNAIAPGVINTEMNSFLNGEEKDSLQEEIPMGRFGEAEEIGKVSVFLASDEASYITGQTIKVDGGFI